MRGNYVKMRFVINVRQCLEKPPQFALRAVIFRGDNQAKPVVAVPITVGPACLYNTTEMRFDRSPVRSIDHDHEQSPTDLENGIAQAEQIRPFPDADMFKHFIRAATPKRLAYEAPDRLIVDPCVIHPR